ncbi:MAG TPA: response regulator, partial [Plasticicumulans sp.]|nr:response regulator [Plasticicumulans sp.]
MEPPLPPQSATVPADDDLPPLLLLVDDDALARLALEAMLAGDGYRLETAADGSEALVLAARLLPDLILLDVMMPGMDGYEVCRRLRADPALAEVPVLMLTALDDAASRLLGLDAGADDFIA